MAKDVLVHLDGKKAAELQNFLVHKLSSAPSSPVEGQLYYDTALHKLFYRAESAWVAADGSGLLGTANTWTKKQQITLAGSGEFLALGWSGEDGIRFAGNVGGQVEMLAPGVGPLVINGSSDVQISSSGANKNIILQPNGTGVVKVKSKRITELAAPTEPTDAVNKEYADAITQGLDVKKSVRLATTGALPTNTLVGNVLESTTNVSPEIDEKAIEVGDRILVKNEAEGKKNGIYTVIQKGVTGTQKYKLERAKDADTTGELTGGTYTFVEEGFENADSGWIITDNGTIVINTSAMTWTQFTGAGQIVAGKGLAKGGNTLFVETDADETIKVNADTLSVNSAKVPWLALENTFTKQQTIKGAPLRLETSGGVVKAIFTAAAEGGYIETAGQLQIATSTNIIDLTSPTQVKNVKAPTNATDAANKEYVDGFSTEVGNGSNTSFEFTHGLNSRDVCVEVYRNATPWDTVAVHVERPSAEKVKVTFLTAPTTNQFRVHVTR